MNNQQGTTTRRVVITGLGVISGLGKSVAEFWNHITQAKNGFDTLQAVDPELLRFSQVAEVTDYDPAAFLSGRQPVMLDRFAQFGLIAANEAVADAAIDWTDALRLRSGVVTGTSIGGQTSHDDALKTLYAQDKNRLHPMTIPRIMPNGATSYISMEFGLRGPAFAVSTACSSSNHAIGQAFWMVRNGLVDLAISGGSETPLNYGFLKAWEAIRVVALDTCRPFSKDRSGLILGEGAAMLVLESLEHAQARGAKIYGEIIGFGMSADAGHITSPDCEGAQRALQAALDDGQVSPEQIDYINAHGTATKVNDKMETEAIRSVFGKHADRLAVSSTKSMHGHALGATSALEAVATVLGLYHSIIPPTANYTEPDPDCDLDVVPNTARQQDIEYALSNAFAFGGLNAVLAFRRWAG